MSSIGFASEIPEPRFFSVVNMDDNPEIQPTDIPRSLAAEISATDLNILSGRSGPSIQSSSRTQFGAGQGTPRLEPFAGNIGGPIVQGIAFDWSRHSHGEGGFGGTLSCGDCPPMSQFRYPNAHQISQQVCSGALRSHPHSL